VGSEVSVAFPPSAVTVRGARQESAARGPVASEQLALNAWHATVGILEPGARGIRVTLRGDTVVAEATPAELLAERVSPGDTVTASIDAAFVTVYPRRVVVPAVRD
jgi:molybdate transport system ATP-binding protein